MTLFSLIPKHLPLTFSGICIQKSFGKTFVVSKTKRNILIKLYSTVLTLFCTKHSYFENFDYSKVSCFIHYLRFSSSILKYSYNRLVKNYVSNMFWRVICHFVIKHKFIPVFITYIVYVL